MRLEKVNSASENSSVTGWISSNDVTLFAVVLVVVIALFIQANYRKQSKENARLASETHATETRLAEAATQLKQHEDQLLHFRKERDVLHKQRSDFENLVRRLRNEVDSVSIQRDEAHGDLMAARDEKVQLDQSISLLRRSLARSDEEVKTANRTIAAAEASQRRLKEQWESVRAQYQDEISRNEDLESQMRDQGSAHREKQSQLNVTIQSLRQSLVTSTEQLAHTSKSIELDKASQRELRQQRDGVQAQLQDALSRNERLNSQMQLWKADDTKINRQLVGLNGPLHRVAILVDSSGSMKDDEGRWESVQEVVKTWLQHLEVEYCLLLVFADDVAVFPEDGSLHRVHGPDASTKRGELVDYLARREPGGWTNTLAAFQSVYDYEEIDTIILFTDGNPTSPMSGDFNPVDVEKIYSLCAQHDQIPINAIGVGDYFADAELPRFLRKLAGMTGGTFLGR